MITQIRSGLAVLLVFFLCSLWTHLIFHYGARKSVPATNYKSAALSLFQDIPLPLVNMFHYTPPNYTDPFLLLERKTIPVLPQNFSMLDEQMNLSKHFLGLGLFRLQRSIQNRAYISKNQRSAVLQAINAYISYFRTLEKILTRQRSNRKLGVETEGWFWSSLQAPVFQCHSIKRVGLHWDSGRFVCNPETFYGKHNLVIGIGSNNQYDWEEELFEEFADTSLHISILDCTVSHFRLPETCKNCTTHKMCIGTADTERSIRLSSLAKHLYPNVVDPVIALLKIDVEAWEHVAFPDWLQDTMMHAPTFSVNQIQMEFHRWGHDSVAGTSFTGLLHAHYWMLHMYALGFLPVAKERNYWGSCCYEFAFVNATWFSLDVNV